MKIKQVTKEEYQRRINIVVEYINNNLDDKLDLNKLAELSTLSSYHFHRIVKAFLGETIGTYITRIRVESAARLLRYSNLPIESIAFKVGYEMSSSLSKAFKLYYGISPSEYKNNKDYYIMKPEIIKPELKLKAPKIIELEPKQVIYIRLTGEYSENDYSGTWVRLWGLVKEDKLFSAGIEHISVYHDDPKVTESDKLRTDVCLVIKKPAKEKGEIGVKNLAGGKYAVFLYQGSYANLGSIYDMIYAQWLPDSGYELRNAPMFEKYLNNPNRTQSEKLKTEIYLPIE